VHNIITKSKDVTLLEILDRVLDKGVVISGDAVISVADVDLIYLGLKGFAQFSGDHGTAKGGTNYRPHAGASVTMRLYTYGIIDFSNQINEPIYGLEGARVYNIPYCDIGAVVSEFTEPIQNMTKGSVLAHEEVVERLMERFTVLPVRFHTVLDGRDGVVSLMQSHYKDFRNNLDRLRNKVEFGIKVIWPSDKIKEHIINTCKKSNQKASIPDGTSNKRFIRKKFEEYKIDEEFQKKANKFIKVMDIFFSKFAAEKKLKKLKTENLLLDAVYLVEKDKQGDFKEAFEHIKNPHASFKFLFSGPWPPYNFVILPKKSDLLKDSMQEDLFDKVIQQRDLVGADKI